MEKMGNVSLGLAKKKKRQLFKEVIISVLLIKLFSYSLCSSADFCYLSPLSYVK